MSIGSTPVRPAVIKVIMILLVMCIILGLLLIISLTTLYIVVTKSKDTQSKNLDDVISINGFNYTRNQFDSLTKEFEDELRR